MQKDANRETALLKDVDVNIQDETGRTALHWAATRELDQVYDMLIQHNTTKVDITDNKVIYIPMEYSLQYKIMSYLKTKPGMWPRARDFSDDTNIYAIFW